ncbi:DUF3373 family protein [bacterium]|nr:DUF3373 family protein [bacterium]
MMKKLLVWFVFSMFFLSMPAFASDDVQMLKEQLEKMAQTMEMLQKKIEVMENESKEEKEEAEYLSERVDKTELHTLTDKISLGVEIRTEAHSIQYKDMLKAPAGLSAALMAASPNIPLNSAIRYPMMAGMAPMFPVEKFDAENDFIPTTKFNLNMKAKVNNSLNFTGRLSAYKAWGDSTDVKFNSGSLGDVTLDGNTSAVPHGDTIHLDRAYFVYTKSWNETPISFSLGRRPSTDGPPAEYQKNSLEAGSPLSSIINWQFDGASLNFGLEEVTNIPGFALKFCYGLGFEGGWGNSYSLSNTSSEVDDVHMFGIIATLFDDDSFSAVLNYAHAWGVTDGFTGLTVMPFIVGKEATGYSIVPNSGGYITRMQPTSELGDWDAASLLFRSNLSEYIEKDIDLFLALSWSHTDPSQVSENPFYEMMGQGLLSSGGELEDHNGYSIYAGAIIPMPLGGKWGFEYNWGSKYWFNFTGAEDSITGSKLAARGSVFETYYIQPIVSDNFFLKFGAKYYKYKYTGSGNPLGAPVKISDVSSLDAMFPVTDEVWDVSASLTFKF